MICRKSFFVTVFALALFSACSRSEKTDGMKSEAGVRQTFAKLLKVSPDHPDVEVELHGTTVEDGIRTEDISWKSLDGETVPAFVMRPEKADGPLPVIIALHGSSGSRESMATKEFGRGDWKHPLHKESHKRLIGWARELSRHGYMTLAMTQLGLDTRLPHINDRANTMLIEGRTAMGAVLDEIRQAVTYLTQRPDVDAKKIGATGLSFGGITAFYIWILDDRVTASAPVCGAVGSAESMITVGNPNYHGTYWYVPDLLLMGDHWDFAAPLAPRPLLVWAPTEDVGMPKEGVDRLREALTPLYEKAGKPEALEIHQNPGHHTFSMEAFAAVKKFFDAHFMK